MKYDQFVAVLATQTYAYRHRNSIEDGHNEDFPSGVRQMRCKKSCPDFCVSTLDQFL